MLSAFPANPLAGRAFTCASATHMEGVTMANHQERRVAKAKLRQQLRRQRREISRPGYNAVTDPEFSKRHSSNIVRAVEFTGIERIGGLCLQRALVALQVLHMCRVGIDASLHVGSLLCRVGHDEYRDVVAFCGPGNAGFGQGFHAWIEVGDDISDFSVGDWRGLDPVAIERAMGLTPGEPVQWTVTLPSYWRKPRRSVVDPWWPVGTPALGQAWYGPYDDDPFPMGERVHRVVDAFGAQIAEAVEKVQARFAEQQGLERPDKDIIQPVNVSPIIETRTAPDAPPPGMVMMKMSELFQIAGASLGNVPDAVVYVSERPTTREQVLAMLAT